jgi:glutamate-1-semialdehyde 2,1-aminomutase
MPSLVVSYSHSAEDIQRTIDGIAAALRVYRAALEKGIDQFLEGRPVKPVFRKFN